MFVLAGEKMPAAYIWPVENRCPDFQKTKFLIFSLIFYIELRQLVLIDLYVHWATEWKNESTKKKKWMIHRMNEWLNMNG